MTLPRTSQLLTIRLLPWDAQVSKHALVLMLPALPPHPRRVCGVTTYGSAAKMSRQLQSKV